MHTQVDAMVVVRAVFAVRTTARFHAGQSNVPASNQAHRHHTVTHCSLSRPPPQVSNGQESFKPIKITTYSRPSDVWSAGLMVNDMGTGFRLLGHPVISAQLSGNMFHIFGVPTPEMWPGVQHLDGYKQHNCGHCMSHMISLLRTRLVACWTTLRSWLLTSLPWLLL